MAQRRNPLHLMPGKQEWKQKETHYMKQKKKNKVTVTGCTDWKDRLAKSEKLTLRVKNWSGGEPSLH